MLTRRGRQCHNECLLALADTPPPPPPNIAELDPQLAPV